MVLFCPLVGNKSLPALLPSPSLELLPNTSTSPPPTAGFNKKVAPQSMFKPPNMAKSTVLVNTLVLILLPLLLPSKRRVG